MAVALTARRTRPAPGRASGDERRLPAGRGRARSTAPGRLLSPSTASRYVGCAGDTLASALIANGVHLVGRSFKYHRPRGILSLGSEEPNALVARRRRRGPRHAESARDADRALRGAEGATSQNALAVAANATRWRSTACSSAFMPAGFYYKTFMRPEGRVGAPLRAGDPPRGRPRRRAARRPTPIITPIEYAHCDVAVVGGGPAGLAAALRGGARRRAGHPVRRAGRVRRLAARRDASARSTAAGAPTGSPRRSPSSPPAPHVTLLPRTQAFGYYAQNFLAAERAPRPTISPTPIPRLPRERLWQVRAQAQVVLATGAHRAPAGVPRQRPARASCSPMPRATLRNRYGVKPGARVVVADRARRRLSRRARPRRGGRARSR